MIINEEIDQVQQLPYLGSITAARKKLIGHMSKKE